MQYLERRQNIFGTLQYLMQNHEIIWMLTIQASFEKKSSDRLSSQLFLALKHNLF